MLWSVLRAGAPLSCSERDAQALLVLNPVFPSRKSCLGREESPHSFDTEPGWAQSHVQAALQCPEQSSSAAQAGEVSLYCTEVCPSWCCFWKLWDGVSLEVTRKAPMPTRCCAQPSACLQPSTFQVLLYPWQQMCSTPKGAALLSGSNQGVLSVLWLSAEEKTHRGTEQAVRARGSQHAKKKASSTKDSELSGHGGNLL